MKNLKLCWLLIPVLNTLYQIFIKMAAQQMAGLDFGMVWLHRAATSPWMVAAVISEIICFAVWIKILAQQDLSKAFPMSGISYLLILATSWLVFNEHMQPLQIVGSTFIFIGVLLVGKQEA